MRRPITVHAAIRPGPSRAPMAAATARRTAPAIRTYGQELPLLLETARECLQDVYDMPALNEVMTGLQAGTITVKDVETESPSPFAENILFGFVAW